MTLERPRISDPISSKTRKQGEDTHTTGRTALSLGKGLVETFPTRPFPRLVSRRLYSPHCRQEIILITVYGTEGVPNMDALSRRVILNVLLYKV